MKDKDINEIVEEICRLEPKLASQKKQLRSLVAELLAAKPEVQADAQFLEQLKQEAIAALGERPQKLSWGEKVSRVLAGISRPVYALAGAALALVVAIPLLSPGQTPVTGPYLTGLPDSLSHLAADSTGQDKIVEVSNAAFGSLAAGQEPETAIDYVGSGAGTQGLGTTTGFGGGGQYGITAPEAVTISMPVPGRDRYTHVFRYDGQLPTVDSTVDILRFAAGTSDELVSVFRGLGLIDVNQLSQKKTTDFSLVEDKEYGYGVHVNYQRGMVDIYQNHERWPDPFGCVSGQPCQPTPLSPSAVPADSQLIAATDAFLEKYGIDLNGYGSPEVDRIWERQPRMLPETENVWMPDTVTVIYPMVVQGKAVYNEGGQPFGINVSYSLRHKRVVGAGPLLIRNFQSSAYPAQTDTSELTAAIRRGGTNRWLDEEAENRIEYGLGEPEDIYLLTYRYDQGEAQQLLVPGWAFAVDRSQVDDDDYPYWSDQVVIPLAADMYERSAPPVMIQSRGGQPEPMPAIEPMAETLPSDGSDE